MEWSELIMYCRRKRSSPTMNIYLGQLINWLLQKLSILIGRLAIVHICDWLIKDKQIYKLSSIIFMVSAHDGLTWAKTTLKRCIYSTQLIFDPNPKIIMKNHLGDSKDQLDIICLSGDKWSFNAIEFKVEFHGNTSICFEFFVSF